MDSNVIFYNFRKSKDTLSLNDLLKGPKLFSVDSLQKSATSLGLKIADLTEGFLLTSESGGILAWFSSAQGVRSYLDNRGKQI